MNLLRVLCVLCGLLSPAFALDRNAFTFVDYDLRARVTPASAALEVTGKLTLRNDSAAAQRVAVLQVSSSLEWRSITIAGKPVQYLTQPYTTDIDHSGALSEAVVTLPAAVAPGGAVTLEVAYAGEVRQDATRLTRIGTPEQHAANNDWDGIADPFSVVRGAGYVAWYPIATEAASLSQGNELFQTIAEWKRRSAAARLRLELCVAAGEGPPPAVLMNLPDSNTIGNCRVFLSEALSSVTPTLAIGPYQALAQPVVRIDHLAGRQEMAADWARAAARVSALTQQWFGPRTRQLHIIELPWGAAAAWESENVLFTPVHNLAPEPLQLLLAHPLAHASLRSPRPWIEEGLGHFAQALEQERQGGRRAAIEYMERQTGPLITASSTDDEVALQPLATSDDDIDFRIKAMRVWWMLRDLVGDEPLRRALRAYRPEQDREPSYLQRLIESETKRKLEWFFDDWVYRDRGLSELRVVSAYPRQAMSGVYLVTVTVENTGGAAAEAPVRIETPQGEVSKRMLVPGGQKTVVRIEVPAAPLRVIVNDGSVPEFDATNNVLELPAAPRK